MYDNKKSTIKIHWMMINHPMYFYISDNTELHRLNKSFLYCYNTLREIVLWMYFIYMTL